MIARGLVALAALAAIPAVAAADEPLPDVHHGEVAAPTPAPVDIAEGDGPGWHGLRGAQIEPPRPPLEADQIEQVFQRQAPMLRRCLGPAVLRDPAAFRRRRTLVLELEIKPDGGLRRVEATTRITRVLDRCLVERVMRVRFPPSRAGARVRYPLVFVARSR